jgi:hypothetical protein
VLQPAKAQPANTHTPSQRCPHSVACTPQQANCNPVLTVQRHPPLWTEQAACQCCADPQWQGSTVPQHAGKRTEHQSVCDPCSAKKPWGVHSTTAQSSQCFGVLAWRTQQTHLTNSTCAGLGPAKATRTLVAVHCHNSSMQHMGTSPAHSTRILTVSATVLAWTKSRPATAQ